MSPKATDDDASLKRLAGQGWQTRDGRFTIEVASGTWSLVDAEQTDDLGLPLVRGPYRSLADAKAAIEQARSSDAPTSALKDRAKAAPKAEAAKAETARDEPAAKPKTKAKPAEASQTPRWLSELDATDRRRAQRLISRLEERGVRDAEGSARRDVAGDVPEVPRIAIADLLAEALDGAGKDEIRAMERVLMILVEGRDENLDVRWRIVDDQNRPVGVSSQDVAAARKRRSGQH